MLLAPVALQSSLALSPLLKPALDRPGDLSMSGLSEIYQKR